MKSNFLQNEEPFSYLVPSEWYSDPALLWWIWFIHCIGKGEDNQWEPDDEDDDKQQ